MKRTSRLLHFRNGKLHFTVLDQDRSEILDYQIADEEIKKKVEGIIKVKENPSWKKTPQQG